MSTHFADSLHTPAESERVKAEIERHARRTEKERERGGGDCEGESDDHDQRASQICTRMQAHMCTHTDPDTHTHTMSTVKYCIGELRSTE